MARKLNVKETIFCSNVPLADQGHGVGATADLLRYVVAG